MQPPANLKMYSTTSQLMTSLQEIITNGEASSPKVDEAKRTIQVAEKMITHINESQNPPSKVEEKKDACGKKHVYWADELEGEL